MKKVYIFVYIILLIVLSSSVSSKICDYKISSRWTDGAIIKVYDYGKVENSRFFMPNIIKIYGGCNKDALIHELAHYDDQKLNHNSFFWLSYYRIRFEVYDEI